MLDGGSADTYRLVLDESSFDFRGHDDEDVCRAVSLLNDLFEELNGGRHPVARWSDVYEIPCRDDLALYDVLFGRETALPDRDERQRLMRLLDRLPCWDDAEPAGVPLEVHIDERGPVFAPTVGYALLAATKQFSVACVTLPLADQAGPRAVRGECGEGEVFFLTSTEALPRFWRASMISEKVSESEFYRRGEDAFPNLVLHEGLSFGSFDGSYQNLRESVLAVLAEVNDRFAAVWDEVNGQPHEVEARMGSRGVDMSRESVKTRGSHKHMAMRDVDHDGKRFRCEWHAKLERHRNRIHFSLPDPALDGRILIGLFVDHLPTA
ncbi:hypothetical protein [Saccharothrix longispora]|uniref:hypothetical protein n=1 Tax=Saccharothrix longispora TaxID=33920 RepID=UPI0028FD1635|nr:hypothetical protein [Saccharothrix longispora]MDU0290644.1 hypothetical protein [Saccharothrix longispora]